MKRFVCSVCGYVYEGEEAPAECPACHQPGEKFTEQPGNLTDTDSAYTGQAQNANVPASDLSYDKTFYRTDTSCRYMEEIHQMAVSGQSVSAAMGTSMPMPGWNDILFLGAQLNPAPLDDDAPVSTMTVIGKNAKMPMILDSPVYISHMSFGALSREIKVALARGSAMAQTAMCSGEGGILPEEQKAAYKYIFEYVPNKYSVTDENLRAADAVEIKIGQGTKPGMGGHLPGEKVTEEIARLRGKKQGEDVQSPSKFPEINSKEDLKTMVSMLRRRSGGRPVGIKIAAGRIERDLEYCVYAEPDFITIDGRGGATGSSPYFLRESTTIPTVYALYRARKYLDAVRSDISLVITGGLRVSSDVAKALAMGADAVAVASAALIAAACQQYRICGSGHCPVGVATQDPALRERLNVEQSARRVANYLNVMKKELKTFARITGHSSVHDLSVKDLVTTTRDISDYTNIPHA
jgi:glutamate synthase domain-containing protein 2/rubredoxin